MFTRPNLDGHLAHVHQPASTLYRLRNSSRPRRITFSNAYYQHKAQYCIMAPQSRKRKSEAMEETPRPQTPTGSPSRKKLKITQSEKQALIDNLQLESMYTLYSADQVYLQHLVTERARHLRAHYALQCADLRSRIERRVNRIPIAMRKMTMGELIAKHSAPSKPQVTRIPSDTNKTLPPLPHESKPASPIRPIAAPAGRTKKRKSSDIHIASDHDAPEPLPTKKTRTTKATTTGTQRATSRAKPTSVLSPRSHNSRTLPRSPIKEPTSPFKSSPAKSYIARPISPLKPTSPLKSAASAATSAITAAAHGMIEHAKRSKPASRTTSREKLAASTTATKGKMLPPPRPQTAPSSPARTASASTSTSEQSSTSTNSNGTVVKATGTVRGRPKAAASKPTATKAVTTATAKASALKTSTKAVNKKVVVAEPAGGRRVLRKRN
jgi:hypothetical protein